MQVDRNAQCPCGSGKKYKNCCGIKKEVREKFISKHAGKLLAPLLVAGLIGLVYAISSSESQNIAAGRVWSAQHGHWHYAGETNKPGSPQPPGPVPKGKQWSVEHGHWHDTRTGSAGRGLMVPHPPGPTPKGKAWSPEHGHWHDAF